MESRIRSNVKRVVVLTLVVIALLAVKQGAGAAVDDSRESAVTSIAIYPPIVKLSAAGAHQPLVVQATYADGVTKDVTADSRFEVADAAIARMADLSLYAEGNGDTSLRVRYGDLSEMVSVEVRNATVAGPLSFRNDVIPVFSKVGCNAGACHGASRGKDGFNLSLVGYDPAGDHYRLTEEVSGRRVNLALPAESLLLEKATGKVPHTGGVAFDETSPHYATLLKWLELSAPDDSKEAARIDQIEVFPAAAVLQGKGQQQRVRVIASYSDGTTRDVTALARFETSNEFSATIDDEAVITAHGRGEAFLSVHFDEHTVGCHLIVLPAELEFTRRDVPAANYVDTLVYDKLKKLRIHPSELATDGEFLRRVTLDLTGRLPTVAEFEAFEADQSPTKRAAIIDDLMARPEFADVWVMKWADLLQMRTGKVGRKSLMRYHGWLREKVEANTPLDRMVHDLLAANGGTFSNAATNYYQSESETLKTAENAAQAFLGMRLQCAQCHNHLFDRWTMEDYYGFAAFFAHIGRKPGEDPRETIIYNKGSGDTKHPLTKKKMQPRFLGEGDADVENLDRRVVLAKWITDRENPYFARHMANTIWAHFFGKGIVDPVDDVRVSNPPVNPQLLDELSRRLVAYEFDMKRLVRDICNSRIYQLSAIPNDTNIADERNFSHAALRRVPAAVLLDAVSQVTETRDRFKDVPEGTRAVQIPDGATTNYFMTTFGRSARETVCTCETRAEPNLSQALHLINGNTVQGKINKGKVVQRQLKAGRDVRQVVEDLYVRTLSRRPTEAELAAVERELADKAKKRDVLRDLFWALLNSQEFLFNH